MGKNPTINSPKRSMKEEIMLKLELEAEKMRSNLRSRAKKESITVTLKDPLMIKMFGQLRNG